MKPIRDPDVIARVQKTFELYETAVATIRENLRRQYPDENEKQIGRRVAERLHDRPGAKYGDASGPSFRVRRIEGLE